MSDVPRWLQDWLIVTYHNGGRSGYQRACHQWRGRSRFQERVARMPPFPLQAWCQPTELKSDRAWRNAQNWSLAVLYLLPSARRIHSTASPWASCPYSCPIELNPFPIQETLSWLWTGQANGIISWTVTRWSSRFIICIDGLTCMLASRGRSRNVHKPPRCHPSWAPAWCWDLLYQWIGVPTPPAGHLCLHVRDRELQWSYGGRGGVVPLRHRRALQRVDLEELKELYKDIKTNFKTQQNYMPHRFSCPKEQQTHYVHSRSKKLHWLSSWAICLQNTTVSNHTDTKTHKHQPARQYKRWAL